MAERKMDGIVSCVDPLFGITRGVVEKAVYDLGKYLAHFGTYDLTPQDLHIIRNSEILLLNILPYPKSTGGVQIIGDPRLLEHILLPFPEPNTALDGFQDEQDGPNNNGDNKEGFYYPGITLIENIRGHGLTLPVMPYTSGNHEHLNSNLKHFRRLSAVSLYRLPRHATLFRQAILNGLSKFTLPR